MPDMWLDDRARLDDRVRRDGQLGSTGYGRFDGFDEVGNAQHGQTRHKAHTLTEMNPPRQPIPTDNASGAARPAAAAGMAREVIGKLLSQRVQDLVAAREPHHVGSATTADQRLILGSVRVVAAQRQRGGCRIGCQPGVGFHIEPPVAVSKFCPLDAFSWETGATGDAAGCGIVHAVSQLQPEKSKLKVSPGGQSGQSPSRKPPPAVRSRHPIVNPGGVVSTLDVAETDVADRPAVDSNGEVVSIGFLLRQKAVDEVLAGRCSAELGTPELGGQVRTRVDGQQQGAGIAAHPPPEFALDRHNADISHPMAAKRTSTGSRESHSLLASA